MKRKNTMMVAALCAAGALAWGAMGADAHTHVMSQGQSGENGASRMMQGKGQGSQGTGMFSFSQWKQMRDIHDETCGESEKRIQAMGAILFEGEKPAEGQLFAPGAVKALQPEFEKMVLLREGAMEKGRKLLTEDQKTMLSPQRASRRGGAPGGRGAQRPGGALPGGRFLGAYVERSLGLTSSQSVAFRKAMEVDGVTLREHHEQMENHMRKSMEGSLSPEEQAAFAKEQASCEVEHLEQLNKALESIYPTFSENQKKAFEEMREHMAENTKAGLFLAPSGRGQGMRGGEGHSSGEGHHTEHVQRQSQGKNSDQGQGQGQGQGKNSEQGQGKNQGQGQGLYRKTGKAQNQG